jgi:hypothetical protein
MVAPTVGVAILEVAMVVILVGVTLVEVPTQTTTAAAMLLQRVVAMLLHLPIPNPLQARRSL